MRTWLITRSPIIYLLLCVGQQQTSRPKGLGGESQTSGMVLSKLIFQPRHPLLCKRLINTTAFKAINLIVVEGEEEDICLFWPKSIRLCCLVAFPYVTFTLKLGLCVINGHDYFGGINLEEVTF